MKKTAPKGPKKDALHRNAHPPKVMKSNARSKGAKAKMGKRGK